MTDKEYKEFKEFRRAGIGGSDISAILGLNKYSTPIDIYLSKINNEDSFNGNEFTVTGQKLEDYVARRFENATNLKSKVPAVKSYMDQEHKYFIASLDREINSDTVLEIKTTRRKLTEPDINWICQVQWYMGVTGRKQAVICWLTLPSDFDYKTFANKEFTNDDLTMFDLFTSIDWVTIDRDDIFINRMREEAFKFWNEFVLTKTPPPFIEADDVTKLYPEHTQGKALEINEDVYRIVTELKSVKDNIKALNEVEYDLTEGLKMLFLDNETMSYSGQEVATFKTQVTKRFNSSKFKNDNKELYNLYTEPSTSRVLRLKSN